MSGLDLSPLWQGRRLGRDGVYADRQGDDRHGKTGQRSRMLRTATRKLVHDEDRDVIEVWAVDGSSAECVDLSEQEPQARVALVKAYWGLREGLHRPGHSTGHGDIDPETERRLQQQGYVEGRRSP